MMSCTKCGPNPSQALCRPRCGKGQGHTWAHRVWQWAFSPPCAKYRVIACITGMLLLSVALGIPLFNYLIYSISNSMNSEARITLCVFLMLRWQLGPTQMKCTCNVNDSIYIPFCFLIKMYSIWGHIY